MNNIGNIDIAIVSSKQYQIIFDAATDRPFYCARLVYKVDGKPTIFEYDNIEYASEQSNQPTLAETDGIIDTTPRHKYVTLTKINRMLKTLRNDTPCHLILYFNQEVQSAILCEV